MVERGSSGKIRLKQVAQYPSYFTLPLLESIQSIQWGHLAPPPCSIHLSDLFLALFLQLGSTHLAPPPCSIHLSVLPFALFLQLGSTHSFLLDRCNSQYLPRGIGGLIQFIKEHDILRCHISIYQKSILLTIGILHVQRCKKHIEYKYATHSLTPSCL